MVLLLLFLGGLCAGSCSCSFGLSPLSCLINNIHHKTVESAWASSRVHAPVADSACLHGLAQDPGRLAHSNEGGPRTSWSGPSSHESRALRSRTAALIRTKVNDWLCYDVEVIESAPVRCRRLVPADWPLVYLLCSTVSSRDRLRVSLRSAALKLRSKRSSQRSPRSLLSMLTGGSSS